MTRLTLLAGLAVLQLCRAQMESPLKGTGVPGPNTTEVYVSAYLDRLLKVDEDAYRWEASLYFYVSWLDPAAYESILASSAQMLANSSFQCSYYCSNVAERVLCCDNVWLPSFLFKNAYGFPQDRAIAYNIYPASDGSILREVRVHGQFYQPMDFSHFPFDSMDLLIELRFQDPTVLFNEGRPGVKLIPSSGGRKLFTYGKGDDTSSWSVTDFSLFTYDIDMGAWYQEYSDVTSDAGDPMPLAPVSTNWTQADESGQPVNVFTGVSDQLLGVQITIERFWKPSLINAVLPVVLVYLLGMLVFFCDEAELPTRLEIIVALFLALTAVQFVVAGTIPTSSYVVPTQQLVLATYLFLFLLAVESIIVFHIVRRHENREKAKRRKEAYRRYCKLRDRGKLAGGRNPPVSEADMSPAVSRDTTQEAAAGQLATWPEDEEAAAAGQGAAAGDAAVHAAASLDDEKGMNGGGNAAAGAAAASAAGSSKSWRQRFGLCFRTPKQQPEPRVRQLTSFRHMTADQAYGEYVGHLVDTVAAVALGLAYLLTTILIFTLQNGYINIFD